MRKLTVHRLGRVEYADGLALQKRFGEGLATGACPDSLLLLEHPPVITLGRGATGENIVATSAQLAAAGVETFETDRGGDVTYHGPGQLVGYPVFNLAPDRQDVRRYVRDVEAVLVNALHQFGITAVGLPKWPGVWVHPDTDRMAKIAAIGVHLSRWRTSHGFALNVNTQLSHFELIVPCGIREAGVTSMARELGREVPLAQVEAAIAESCARVFGAELTYAPPPQRTVSVTVIDRSTARTRVLLFKRTEARGGFWQPVTGRVEAGETPALAAAREVSEELGRSLMIEPLGYEHAFVWGSTVPPVIVEETAFTARWPEGAEVKIDAAEHDAFEWVTPEEATARVPFVGLKVGIARALAT